MFGVLYYESETWTKGKTEEKRILAFKEWYYRQILKISWVQLKITNDSLLKCMKPETYLKPWKVEKTEWYNNHYDTSFLTRIIEDIVKIKI